MIGIVPNEGYRRKDRQSAMAIRWLMWVAHSQGVEIQHAKNQGEKRIGQYKADGYCLQLNKVYEFQGMLLLVKTITFLQELTGTLMPQIQLFF